MIINLRQLTHLPVYTESGIKLGRVCDLEIDVGAHTVTQYLVRPNVLSAKYYLINHTQVKDITAEKIIVFDNVLKVNAAKDFGAMATPEE